MPFVGRNPKHAAVAPQPARRGAHASDRRRHASVGLRNDTRRSLPRTNAARHPELVGFQRNALAAQRADRTGLEEIRQRTERAVDPAGQRRRERAVPRRDSRARPRSCARSRPGTPCDRRRSCTPMSPTDCSTSGASRPPSGVVRRTVKLYVVRSFLGLRRPGIPFPEMSVCVEVQRIFANESFVIVSGSETPAPARKQPLQPKRRPHVDVALRPNVGCSPSWRKFGSRLLTSPGSRRSRPC